MVKCPENLLEGNYSNIYNWVASFLFWLISTIVLKEYKDVRKGIKELDFNYLIKIPAFRAIIAFYSFYLLCQIFTTGFRKFMRFQRIHTVLKKNIENKFKIKYHGEAWHMVEVQDDDGGSSQRKVRTFKETCEYEFNSGADYSVISINSDDINNKRYFDLEIEYEYIALDRDTFDNESKAYSNFYNRTNCDEFFSVKKLVDIKGGHSKNIISFGNCFIVFLDKLIFLICILLSLGQIYKYVISCFISKKTIKVTKIISNDYDLTQSDAFFNIQPKVNLFGEDLKYDREKCTFKNIEGLKIMIYPGNPISDSFNSYNSYNTKYDNIKNTHIETNIGDIIKENDFNDNNDNTNYKFEMEQLK